MKRILHIQYLLALILFILTNNSIAQSNYNDGPVRLRVWAHKAWSSANCGEIGNKEYIIKDVLARVNNNGVYQSSTSGLSLSFNGSASRYFNLPTGNDRVPAGMVSDANGYRLLDVTYNGTAVPDRFQVYLGSAYEEDCTGDGLSCGQGSAFSMDECCCLFGICALSDDYFISSSGWADVFYRGGVEGQINYTQPIILSAGGEHKYTVVFAYQWDMLEEKPLCASPVYKDGNITVTADVVGFFADMNWDGGSCGISIAGAEDLRAKVMAVDGAASFGTFPTGTNTTMKFSQDVPQWNTGGLSSTYTNSFGSFSSFPVRIFNTTYNTVATNFSNFKIAYDVWEEDGWYLSLLGLGLSCGTDEQYEGNGGGGSWYCVNSDDAHYTSIGGSPFTYSTVPAVNIKNINWRLSPPNTDNYMDIPISLSSSSYQSWIMRIKYRWTISPPTVSIAGTNDLNYCMGTTAATLTATTTNATYYKWQVSNQTYAPASCGSANSWTDIPGQYCSTYVPPQTPGTRLYRCIVYNRGGSGSDVRTFPNNGPKYDSAISNCIRVNYFPYAPPITSAVCGGVGSAATLYSFSATQVPNVGAIANPTSVSWSVSPSTGVTIATPALYTTNITFTNTGSYTITFTVNRTGCPSATTTCNVQIGPTTCDYIYVSPSGVNGNQGSASSPVRTLTGAGGALSKVSGSLSNIRMLNGAYAEAAKVVIPSNVVIDGGYTIDASNNWTKTSNSSTNITCSYNEYINTNVEHIIGFSSVGTSNWKLIDLNITTSAATGNISGTRNGKSNYAVYINGASNYEIIRCNITSGNASAGLGRNNVAGTAFNGSNGSQGAIGNVGPGGNSSCGYDGGVSGANGGSGGAGGANATRIGGSAGSGGAGGKGGYGRDDNGDGCWGSGCRGGQGANGASVTGCTGGGGGLGSLSDNGNNNTPTGDPGGTGGTGSAGNNGTNGTAAHSGGWYVPGWGSNGTAGTAGCGGGGGGGGNNDEGNCDAGGGGGSGGSGGGGGGGAGAGGTGGGGSFGIYIWSGGAGGVISNSVINTGAVGTGGTGGLGGSGGLARSGQGLGNNSGDSQSNRGGAGGGGGAGGKGGNGGNGSTGVRYAVAQQNGGTAPTFTTISPAITINSSVSGGAIPASPIVTLAYYQGRLCKNSVLPITKTTGTWTLPANYYYVKNLDETTSSYNSSSTPAEVYTDVANTWLNLQAGTTVYPRYLRVVTDDRQPIDITSTVEEKYCIGDAINLTASVWGVVTEHRWRLYSGNTATGTPIWTGTTANPTLSLTTGAIPGLVPGNYILKYDQDEQCCNWSLPVYRKFTLYNFQTPPNAWSSAPTSGNYCTNNASAAVLTVGLPTGQTGGTPGGTPSTSVLMYRISYDGGATWGAWTTFVGGGPFTIPKAIGQIRVQSAYITPGAPAGCDTSITPIVISWNIDDTIPASAYLLNQPRCGNPNLFAELQSAVPAAGNGLWSVIFANGTSSTPSVPTSTNDILITNLPSAGGTATYRWTVTNGLCTTYQNVAVNAPTLYPNYISMDTLGCYDCSIADGVTYTYYDYRGDIMMKVQDLTGGAYSTSALNSTEICQRIVTPNISPTPMVITNHYGDLMPYLKRYWTIRPEGINLPAKITLYFTSGELANLILGATGTAYAFSSINQLQVSKFPFGGNGIFTGPDNILNNNGVPGGEMIVTGGYAGAHPLWTAPVFSTYGSDYKVEFIIDEFSTFYIHPVRFPYEVLPIELVSFTGMNIGDKNKLEWVTSSEINTDKFIVEKSLDGGQTWFYVGEKPAAGNSTATLNYNLFDLNPVIGDNYYRLKIIDLDGTYKYSDVINIVIEDVVTSGFGNIYPNPTSGMLNVEIQSTNNYQTNIITYDVIGQIVADKSINLSKGLNKVQFDYSMLAKGTYIIRFTDNKDKTHVTKFVKD